MSAPTSTINKRDGHKLVVAKALGVSSAMTFHDVYSLTEHDLLALVSRPVHTLIINCPGASYRAARAEENTATPAYETGDKPIKQARRVGLAILHCFLNGPARKFIEPGSILARLYEAMVPLKREPRAKILEDSIELEEAHATAADLGQSDAPELSYMDTHDHFLAFVKGDDDHLWEMCGYAPAPVDCGASGKGEDALSKTAVKLGAGAFLEKAQESEGFYHCGFLAVVRALTAGCAAYEIAR